MLLIKCPWCGERDEIEFRYGHEAHIARPEDPEALDDKEWADFLFMKTNTKGLHQERWMHAQGCRRWFNAVRDTVSHEILAVYKIDDERPDLDALRAAKEKA
ncbi:sarcosine oxidase subunit delta [Coralliovum pocilloporae]|uniref:sarcosine oxidase subunit delta n=1 Tax=Coralliovum pocilloporae TaxID=3066369 RepID=UPI0033079F05